MSIPASQPHQMKIHTYQFAYNQPPLSHIIAGNQIGLIRLCDWSIAVSSASAVVVYASCFQFFLDRFQILVNTVNTGQRLRARRSGFKTILHDNHANRCQYPSRAYWALFDLATPLPTLRPRTHQGN
jgi:hypothetical protein